MGSEVDSLDGRRTASILVACCVTAAAPAPDGKRKDGVLAKEKSKNEKKSGVDARLNRQLQSHAASFNASHSFLVEDTFDDGRCPAQQPKKTGATKLLPNATNDSDVRDFVRKACARATSANNPSMRTLCPWVTWNNYDPDRRPQLIPEAYPCRQSCHIPSGTAEQNDRLSFDAECVPVLYRIPVLRPNQRNKDKGRGGASATGGKREKRRPSHCNGNDDTMEKPVFQFTAAKRKRQSAPCTTSPFPIPIESITGSPLCRWNFYSGQLIGSSVQVAIQSDMTSLYEMGFFGKGNLSWSGPEYNITKQDAKNFTRKHCRLTSRRNYLQHCRWAAASSRSAAPLYAADEYPLPYPKKKPPMAATVSMEPCPQVSAAPVDVVEQKPVLPFPAFEDWPTDPANNEEDEDLDDDPWAKTAEEETQAFWGSSSRKSASSSMDISSRLAANPDEIDSEVNCWLSNSKTTVKPAGTSTETDDSLVVTDVTLGVNCMQETSSCTTDKLDTEDIRNSCTTADVEECQQTLKDAGIDTESSSSTRVRGICRTVDSRCAENDADADILVVDDTDDSDVDDDARMMRPQWRMVRKKDPSPLMEHLHLSLEEAFFLSYGLGCLSVTDAEKVTLNLADMWQRFCRISPRFVERYVVYHNLRSKGWVPKPGLKFGVDFVLYKRGPPFYHASYSVLVDQVRGDDLEPVLSSSAGSTSWTSLSCLNRITEQVSKELMICHVIRPTDLSELELSSPLCISKFKVMEVVIRRWVSKRERENAEFLLIP